MITSSSKAITTTARPLHVVLEHRNSKEFKSYLNHLNGKRPTKLGIFSDFQWIQTGHIIKGEQRQQLFQVLSEICGNLRRIQIDLLCDLFLPDVVLNLEDISSSDNDATHLLQRLQVLPCSLVTCLLTRAPLLETLSLKELFLSGSDEEVQELVHTLESHPTLRQVDLRWKLAGSSKGNHRILDPLIYCLAQMPQLEEVNLMIPHWCPSLQQLPLSPSLRTVKLTVENIPDSSSMTQLLRDWKRNTVLKHLEVSSFQILQDTSALLELIGPANNNQSKLEHLVVIDHNIFRSRNRQQPKRSKSNKSITNNYKDPSQFVRQLTTALQSNTSLRHLHLISKNTRRRASAHDKMEQDHRQLLGAMMEYNFVLEHLKISHCGVQISAPKQPATCYAGGKDYQGSPLVMIKRAPTPKGDDDDKLDFYLRLNQDGFRRQLLLKGDRNVIVWHPDVQHYQNDMASLFSLIQAAPSVLVDAFTSINEAEQ